MKKWALKNISDGSWKREVLASRKPVLVYFGIPGNPLCLKQERNIALVLAHLGNKASVGRVNVQTYPSLASRYGISGIPTMLLFYRGLLCRSFIGLIDAVTLREALAILGRLGTIKQRLTPLAGTRR